MHHQCSINTTQNGPRQANLVLIAYASSEGSGEPAHPHSLARTSAARSYKQCVKRQKAICHDGMLEDTNSLGGAQIVICYTV